MTEGRKPEHNDLTRRGALLRLGLGAVAAYVAPSVLTVSEAIADSKDSDSSGPSGPGGGGGGGGGGDDGGGGRREPDTCGYHHSGDDSATMPERDYRKAQAAVDQGRALPLREVFKSVIKKLGGRFVEVRFKDSRSEPAYQLRMISGKGSLIAVHVEAATGRITKISDC
ncbi:MAG: PepSY domain-containing protein [Paracoccaceae bacterium]